MKPAFEADVVPQPPYAEPPALSASEKWSRRRTVAVILAACAGFWAAVIIAGLIAHR